MKRIYPIQQKYPSDNEINKISQVIRNNQILVLFSKREISFKTSNNEVLLRKYLLMCLLMANCQFLFCQTELSNHLYNVVPPSPNAASLGKYGEYPVSYYTGTVNINIPIWNIQDKGFSLPISLSYHPSGIKVSEIASSVGLGWSLNAGGVITRSKVGLPDEGLNGFFNTNRKIPTTLLNTSPVSGTGETVSVGDYLFDVLEEDVDSNPDLFFFNFNGYSGKIVFDQEGVPYTIPHQKIKIEYAPQQWNLTTPDGVEYIFGNTGGTEYTSTEGIGYTLTGSRLTSDETPDRYVSAWYLKEIITPNGSQISIDYEPEEYFHETGKAETRVLNSAGQEKFDLFSASTIRNKVEGLRVRSIQFDNGSVEFIWNDNPREDLQHVDGSLNLPKALRKVVVNNQASDIKSFLLDTDYFISDQKSPDLDRDFLNKRLKLNSIQEFSKGETESKPPHTFQYDEAFSLPYRHSNSIDYWGYYNGKENTSNHNTLIPTFEFDLVGQGVYLYDIELNIDGSINSGSVLRTTIPNPLINPIRFEGADRTPNPVTTSAGILKEIQYPTGGTTRFEYGPNEYILEEGPLYKTIEYDRYVSARGSTCTANGEEVLEFVFDGEQPTFITVIGNFFGQTQAQNFPGGCDAYFKFENVTLGRTYTPNMASLSGVERYESNYDYYNPSERLELINGHTYRLTAKVCCDPNVITDVGIYWSETTNEVETYNGISGGLRIDKVINVPSEGETMITKYDYHLSGNKARSSGTLLDKPQHSELTYLMRSDPNLLKTQVYFL